MRAAFLNFYHYSSCQWFIWAVTRFTAYRSPYIGCLTVYSSSYIRVCGDPCYCYNEIIHKITWCVKFLDSPAFSNSEALHSWWHETLFFLKLIMQFPYDLQKCDLSELGGPSGKSFRLVRACVRAVCMSSEIGVKNPGPGLSLFPFWPAMLSLFPWGFPPSPPNSYPALAGLIGLKCG